MSRKAPEKKSEIGYIVIALKYFRFKKLTLILQFEIISIIVIQKLEQQMNQHYNVIS